MTFTPAPANSGLIKLFLRFLKAAGIETARLGFRVHIHESADVASAEQFWFTVTGAEPAQFHKTSLKRHNPQTVRKNVGAEYHGCLIVTVSGSADLYRKIEGWVRGAMTMTLPPHSLVGRQDGLGRG